MPDVFSGLGARLYAFATGRIFVLRDLQETVAGEISRRVSEGTVLDVGTGPGYLPLKIASGNQSLEVVGLDVSRDMVRIARTSSKRASAENVHFLVGDVERLGIQDESVDLAVATLSFHHWLNPARAFEEVCRVLKIGAEVWIYEVARDLTRESREQLKKRYNPLAGRFAGSVIRMLIKHSITIGDAEAF